MMKLTIRSTRTLLTTAAVVLLVVVKQTDGFTPSSFTMPSASSISVSSRKGVPSSSSQLWDKVENSEGSSTTTTTTVAQVRAEAQDALQNVGWSMPAEGDLTSDDPFVQAIDAGIQRDVGVPLDALLNPAKVVNLERDLYQLRMELAALTGITGAAGDDTDTTITTSMSDVIALTTAACDGGGGGEAADALRQKIAKKEADLRVERRAVFRGWLKNIFLGQAVLSFVLSYVMATNPASLFGGFGWYNVYNMDVSIQVLGYWWWWLFIIPSLRSRRPTGLEKKALDIAFVASPAMSLLAPIATKDTGTIWAANLVVVAAAYAFVYLAPPQSDGATEADGEEEDANTPGWLKFVYKSLDVGSGRERGARK